MIGRGVSAPHIGELYGSRSFFSGDLLGKRTADPERSSPTCYTPLLATMNYDRYDGTNEAIAMET
jgi:hypothetical protein